MKQMSNEEFANAVMGMADFEEPFRAHATYIPEGDCIEFVASNDDYYAERIDGLVTVYYSRETGEIIGSLIKGVHAFCANILEQFPGFKIEIEAGRVKLEHLFRAQLWREQREENDVLVRTYRKLIEVAEETGVDAELTCA